MVTYDHIQYLLRKSADNTNQSLPDKYVALPDGVRPVPFQIRIWIRSTVLRVIEFIFAQVDAYIRIADQIALSIFKIKGWINTSLLLSKPVLTIHHVDLWCEPGSSLCPKHWW